MTEPQKKKKQPRVLRRKTDHSVIERRRREKINDKLVQLQSIVPACKLECQDLFDRRFEQPNADAAKRTSRVKGNDEKVQKAKQDMLEKIRTTMVLEKLCIISHTVDYVQELREEVARLRAICECKADADVSPATAERMMDQSLVTHYREVHLKQGDEEQVRRRSSSNSSSSSTAAPLTPPPEPALAIKRPSQDVDAPEPCRHVQKKRRLHWGSDHLRSTAVRPSKPSAGTTTEPTASSEEDDCELCHQSDAVPAVDRSESEWDDEDDELSLPPPCNLAACTSKHVCAEPQCPEQVRAICKHHPDSSCRHDCASSVALGPATRPSLPRPSQLFPHLHWHRHRQARLPPLSLYAATSTFPSQRYSARP